MQVTILNQSESGMFLKFAVIKHSIERKVSEGRISSDGKSQERQGEVKKVEGD